jgi:hypothetical protein
MLRRRSGKRARNHERATSRSVLLEVGAQLKLTGGVAAVMRPGQFTTQSRSVETAKRRRRRVHLSDARSLEVHAI